MRKPRGGDAAIRRCAAGRCGAAAARPGRACLIQSEDGIADDERVSVVEHRVPAGVCVSVWAWACARVFVRARVLVCGVRVSKHAGLCDVQLRHETLCVQQLAGELLELEARHDCRLAHVRR